MRRASAVEGFAVSVHHVETVWYDTDRWPAWIDGLAHVIEVVGDWPTAGAAVTWESNPAGRGRVVESVVSYEPRTGQIVELEDDSIRGRQSVEFHELEGGVRVELSLDYELKARSVVSPVVDAIFIRRAMIGSLRMTLARLGAELASVAARDEGRRRTHEPRPPAAQ